jgi:hypothetical protein
MDKQIMDLNLPHESAPSSTSTPNNNFIDLIKLRHHQQQQQHEVEEEDDSTIHHNNGIKTKNIEEQIIFFIEDVLISIPINKP